MMFTDLFGGAPHARVFDYLADEPAVDHTITGIARGTEVSRPTVYKVLDDFLDNEVIVQTRTVGNSRFFQINHDNPTVQDLLAVYEPTEIEEIDSFPEIDLGPSTETHRSKRRGKRRRR